MLREFSKGTERFAVKTPLDPKCRNEAKILFGGKAEVQKFFRRAMKDTITEATIHRIAKDVAPSFCRPRRYQKAVPAEENFQRFCSDIHAGKLKIMLKHGNIFRDKNAPEFCAEGGNPEVQPIFSDFRHIVEDSVKKLKRLYSRIVNADYYVLEEIIRVPEDLPYKVGLVTVDTTSMQTHDTGWKDWDHPFECGMFGALKALVVFDLTAALKLGNSAFLAAAAAYISEGVKCQYKMIGKSIICKPWYGSYCVRFNLKTWVWEIAWIKYKGSGKAERILIELNRADRVVKNKEVLFTASAQLFPPFVKMEEFLADYREGFVPPEKNILRSIRLNRGMIP